MTIPKNRDTSGTAIRYIVGASVFTSSGQLVTGVDRKRPLTAYDGAAIGPLATSISNRRRMRARPKRSLRCRRWPASTDIHASAAGIHRMDSACALRLTADRGEVA